MAHKETATEILNAAEALFAERGFAETSLRNITTKADVNLAAVNYHFGSKKSLIHAVFARFLTPFTRDLEDGLLSYEAVLQGKTPDLAQLLTILTQTALKTHEARDNNLDVFMRLLGLAYSQGQGHLRKYLKVEYGGVFSRYMSLMQQASPELNDEQRFWRIHFMLGATIFSISGINSLTAMIEHDLGKKTSVESLIAELLPFITAGFKAESL